MDSEQKIENAMNIDKRISPVVKENELSQLKRFNAFLFSLTQTEEEKNKVTECFTSLKEGNQSDFFQKGCRLIQSFLNNKRPFKDDEIIFVICFLIKSISSALSEETNKEILSLLGHLLDNSELKEKHSQEIVNRTIKTGYSFSGKSGIKYFYLKKFWQEIKYSEETEPPKINNAIPVCLLCTEITNNSLFTKWIDELNVVFVRYEKSSSSSEERELISSLTLRNKLSRETQMKKERTFLQKENTKEELLRTVGMSKKQIEDFFTKYNEISSLKMLYDSDLDKPTAEKCHEKIDNKGATITLIKKGNNFIGGITYQGWNNQQEIVFDAYASIFSISNEMKVFPVQKKECALQGNSQRVPKFGVNDLTVQLNPLQVSIGCNHSSYSLPETFKKEFGMKEDSSECKVERVVIFSFEYDTKKFFQRIFGNEEEANIFINSFKDIEEAKEFLECFENKEQAEEYLANSSDEKEITEYRINFNENERRGSTGSCGNDCIWYFSEKTIFIEGTGKMNDYYYDYCDFEPTAPWSSFRYRVSNVVFEGKISSIGDWAFDDCSSLKCVTISKGVSTIGERAFHSCLSLVNMQLPSSIIEIGKWAFESCYSLKFISIPENVLVIKEGAFSNCRSIMTMTIPSSVKIIESDVFSGCRALTSIAISGDITAIRNDLFSNCSSLVSLTIPNSIAAIGTRAFLGCSSLTEIVLPSNVKTIDDNAFEYCFSLIKVTFSDVLESIGRHSFHGCKSIVSLDIPKAVSEIKERAFENCSSLTLVSIPKTFESDVNDLFYCCENITSFTFT